MSENEVQETETAVETEKTEAPAFEVNTDTSINASLDEIDDPDTLKKMVAKLRKENANARVKKNATEQELAEFRAWKESQMTEQEKLQKRAEELEQKYLATKREAILRAHGIDPEDELAELVVGDEAQMEKVAATLAARIARETETNPVPDVFKNSAGQPVKPGKDDGGSFLEILAREGRL
jgi:hypothetical protein